MESAKVIMTCFAGRKKNMDILTRYVDALYKQGSINEFHIWNFTRNPMDEKWLTENFGSVYYDYYSDPSEIQSSDAQYTVSHSYNYIKTPLMLTKGGDVKLSFKAHSDAHILLTSTITQDDIAEICIGGWDNSKSVMRRRRQGPVVDAYACHNVCSIMRWSEVTLTYETSGMLLVSHNGKVIMSMRVGGADQLFVNVASWGQQKTIWKYENAEQIQPKTNTRDYVKLYTVHNKGKWLEYYHHYTQKRYPNHVIIKCDDDIVFIDTKEFDGFVQRRIANKQNMLAFPSIVNNGVCAFNQQKLGLIPKYVDTFPYDVVCGKLWGDGKLCQRVHEFFTETHETWLSKARSLSNQNIQHPLGDRISINFFAITSDFLHIFQEIGNDDEHELTVTMPKKHSKGHYIDPQLTVAHLGFFKQRETGLDEEEALQKYSVLADKFLSSSK